MGMVKKSLVLAALVVSANAIAGIETANRNILDRNHLPLKADKSDKMRVSAMVRGAGSLQRETGDAESEKKTKYNINLMDAILDFDTQGDWFAGHLSLGLASETIEEGFLNSNKNTNFKLDDVYFDLGNVAKFPAFIRLGKGALDFGMYEQRPVIETLSYRAQKSNAYYAKVGFVTPVGLFVSAYATTKKNPDSLGAANIDALQQQYNDLRDQLEIETRGYTNLDSAYKALAMKAELNPKVAIVKDDITFATFIADINAYLDSHSARFSDSVAGLKAKVDDAKVSDNLYLLVNEIVVTADRVQDGVLRDKSAQIDAARRAAKDAEVEVATAKLRQAEAEAEQPYLPRNFGASIGYALAKENFGVFAVVDYLYRAEAIDGLKAILDNLANKESGALHGAVKGHYKVAGLALDFKAGVVTLPGKKEFTRGGNTFKAMPIIWNVEKGVKFKVLNKAARFNASFDALNLVKDNKEDNEKMVWQATAGLTAEVVNHINAGIHYSLGHQNGFKRYEHMAALSLTANLG
jgi:hypothetical protein